VEVGLYGKLPSNGDFLRRRIADESIDPWDAWLQSAIVASRQILGEGWLDIYLTSPAWRFACEAGACGPAALAGIMVPSVDRVGRYFPLTLMWRIPEELSPLSAAVLAAQWFQDAEHHVIETLGQDEIRFDEFDARVIELGTKLDELNAAQRVLLEPQAAEAVTGATRAHWQIPLGDAMRLPELYTQLLFHRLRVACAPLMLWWTEGSALVAPCALLTPGLPPPDYFAAFLDGSWAERGARSVGATVRAEDSVEALAPEENVEFHSAALSDTGRVRESNQDSFLERSEIGLWAVADGMGGSEGADGASRVVCDALADVTPADTLQATVDRICDRLTEVNTYLKGAEQRPGRSQSGSTVAVLLTRNVECVALWAGDTRIYRMRDGTLEQLTHDHTVALEVATGTSAATAEHARAEVALTRALGSRDTLELDVRRDRVRRGDRFLLCSGGLTREVDTARIEACMRAGDANQSAGGALQAALAAGGRDNVTVIVVDAV
jgi:type VI secretion system protein ImpM